MSTTNPHPRTTEWFDLQVKHGNYDPLPEEVKNEAVSTKLQNVVAETNALEYKNLKQIEQLQLETSNEDNERVLENYRSRRLEELKEIRRRQKFGDLKEIAMSEYVDEVTRASEGEDKTQVVICLLYAAGVPGNVELELVIKALAAKIREVKFVKGLAKNLIPNFNERNCPCLLVYQGGQCLRQIVGLRAFGGLRNLTADKMEWRLGHDWRLFPCTLTESPFEEENRKSAQKRSLFFSKGGGGQSDSENESESHSSSESENEGRSGGLRDKDKTGISQLIKSGASDGRGYGMTELDDIMNLMRR